MASLGFTLYNEGGGRYAETCGSDYLTYIYIYIYIYICVWGGGIAQSV